MDNTITILKRTNGMFGIYVNGDRQENLVHNSSLKDSTEHFISRIMYEINKYPNAEIIFTTDEEKFKSGLPSLEEYLGLK